MALHLFAGIPVANYADALAWYTRLLGKEPSFFPTEVEAVWELAPHRNIYIEERSDRSGQAVVTLLVDDLDGFVSQVARRGIEPVKQETYDNGVRKIIYNDPEGNEIGFAQSPD